MSFNRTPWFDLSQRPVRPGRYEFEVRSVRTGMTVTRLLDWADAGWDDDWYLGSPARLEGLQCRWRGLANPFLPA